LKIPFIRVFLDGVYGHTLLFLAPQRFLPVSV